MATLLGRHMAELAAGARPADIPFPVTSMQPIRGYPFTKVAVRLLSRYYRIRDQLEVT